MDEGYFGEEAMMNPQHCPYCDPNGLKEPPYIFEELLSDNEVIWNVSCGYCDASGPVRKTRDEAIEWWNRVEARKQ